MSVVLLGKGKSNTALAPHFKEQVWALEEKEGACELSEWKDGNFRHLKFISGSFDDLDFSEWLPARVVVSPGIDPRRRFFKIIQEFEVRELDIFAENFKGHVVAITGTDGKSTMTSHVGALLQMSLGPEKIFVGGNLGRAAGEALNRTYGIAVLEVSSYQAERLKKFTPDFAVLLNLAPDHLDRYDRLSDYFDAKWNLLKRSKKVAYPEDLQAPVELLPSCFEFRTTDDLKEVLKKTMKTLSEDWSLSFDVGWLPKLSPLPHRFEIFHSAGGSLYINASKATTVHASLFGLRRAQRWGTVKLILGGKDKGSDYKPFCEVLRSQDSVFVCGAAAEKIQKDLSACAGRTFRYKSLRELLEIEIPKVQRGEILLLAPACASFDEFENFEARGLFFLRQIESTGIALNRGLGNFEAI